MSGEQGTTNQRQIGSESHQRGSTLRAGSPGMHPFFLAIEGPIGVGKTTLARLLEPRFGSNLVLEAFEENPFLSDFYGDRARYAFQTQMFFLLSRYRQQQTIPSLMTDEPVISDYTFGKDSLFAHLNLAGDELEMYERLYTVLAERIALPDLVVYLRADADALMARIAARDRPYERKMDRDYIADVREAYEQYFANYTRTPLLTVDTNDLNYVRDASALAFVEGRTRRALGIGAYQRTLPQMERTTPATIRRQPPRRAYQAWDRGVISEFLGVNEAVARIGATLAGAVGTPARQQTSSLEVALQEALERLESLAHSVGVELKTSRR